MLLQTTLAATTFVTSLTLHELGVSQPSPSACLRNKTLHLIRHAEGWHNVDELEAEAAFVAGAPTWRNLSLHDARNVCLLYTSPSPRDS